MAFRLFLRRACCVGFILPLVCVSVIAAPKLNPFRGFERVEADPNKSYELAEDHGPWHIFAASFAGEHAQREAHDLVLELRRQFKLPAYVHRQDYDFRGQVQGQGIGEDGQPLKMRYRRNMAYEEVAVLVGDFPSADDPRLSKLLERIKYVHPKSLQLGSGEKTSQKYAGWRAMLTGKKEKQRRGPMGKAFVTRNPLLPKEYFSPQGVDKFVMSMNRGVKFSLLKCPKKYTVKVASFRGEDVIDQNMIHQLKQEKDASGRLHDAAEKAHRLAVALRRQGVEAFEFHDRHESIVTVGSFDSMGTPRRDGKTEINPSIHRVMLAYGAQKKPLPDGSGQSSVGLVPKTLAGIPFDIQPQAVKVPRRSIATDYSRPSRWLN